MAIVNKSVFLNYSADQMFALVERIEDYPDFLPWCSKVQIQRDEKNKHVIATLTINFHGFQQNFSTKNIHDAQQHAIHIHLLKGPLKKLNALWSFQPVNDNACHIDFHMDYEFATPFIARLVSPVFDMVANTMVDSFCTHAKNVYG